MTAGLKIMRISHPEALNVVHQAASENIAGYGGDGEWIDDYNDELQNNLDHLFGRVSERPPEASTVLAVMNSHESEMYGAAIVETPYYDQLAKDNEEQARVMSSSHRVLAGMFVVEGYREQGLGRELLGWAANHTLTQQARYLDGFVDDRTGATDFYRRFGAVVAERNQGLPARSPANVPLDHVKEVNGHWFYIDTWPMFEDVMRCSRCEGRLRFLVEDGGRMVCDGCGDPKDLVDQSL